MVGGIVLIVVVVSAIWVAADAHSLGVKRGCLGSGFVDSGVTGWFFVTLLLWIIGFPLYLGTRPKYVALRRGGSVAVVRSAVGRDLVTPYPGIYQRPRRRWGALNWAILIVVVLLLAAATLLVASKLAGPGGLTVGSGQSGAVIPTRYQVQGKAITDAQRLVSGVVRVTCVMPTAWTPGDTFTCYAYGSSGRELAQMAGTVLPSNGDEWQANEVWRSVL